jgi:hypothetical protein
MHPSGYGTNEDSLNMQNDIIGCKFLYCPTIACPIDLCTSFPVSSIDPVQDDALLEIEKGIGNLKQYGAAISDEAKSHVDMLGDVDMDVQQATSQLHHEAKRAVTVR